MGEFFLIFIMLNHRAGHFYSVVELNSQEQCLQLAENVRIANNENDKITILGYYCSPTLPQGHRLTYTPTASEKETK